MISKFLSTKTAKTFVHAFVTSKIDIATLCYMHCAPKYLLRRLQRVLNYAARIVSTSLKNTIT